MQLRRVFLSKIKVPKPLFFDELFYSFRLDTIASVIFWECKMERKLLSLDDPMVVLAKRRFLGSSKKCRLSFEQLFEFFQSGLSRSEVGQKGGVSKQAVQQLYDKYFRFLLDGEGEKLQRWVTAESKFLADPPVSCFVESARSAGCDVGAVLGARGVPLRYRLIVNGHLCKLSWGPTRAVPLHDLKSVEAVLIADAQRSTHVLLRKQWQDKKWVRFDSLLTKESLNNWGALPRNS